jgi:hypothetical protein
VFSCTTIRVMAMVAFARAGCSACSKGSTMRPPITEWVDENVFVRMAVATVALLVAFAVLPSIFAPYSSANAEDLNPRLFVSLSDEHISGAEFAANTELTSTVDSGSGAVSIPGGPYSTNALGDIDADWDHADFDLLAGHLVVVYDGFTNRDHTVTDPAIIGAAIDTDAVSGIAGQGTDVHVWTHGSIVIHKAKK